MEETEQGVTHQPAISFPVAFHSPSFRAGGRTSNVRSKERPTTMPNGGPDCCGNCGFNRAVQEMAHLHPSQREKFWELSYCTLRNIKITNPFWTYCHNFRYGKHLPKEDEKVEREGWVFASGLYEGYVRIPWHGDNEPEVSTPCTCVICGRTTDEGITVKDETGDIGFCTNRHYIDWWKTRHDDANISSEGLDTPEQRYKEKQRISGVSP